MKILFLVNNFPDDKNPYAGVFVYNQVKALLTSGIDIKVLYLDFRSFRRIRRWGMTRYRYNEIEVYRYSVPCGPIKQLYYWLIENVSVKAFLEVCRHEGKFDLIHAHFTDMGIAARKIKEECGMKYVITEHSSTLLKEELDEIEQNNIRTAYEEADKILAVGSALKRKMQQYTSQNIEIVPNILPKRFHVYEEMAKSETEFVFISVVGRLTKEKKVDLVIKAFAELYKEIPYISLKIYGEGKLIEELKEMVRKMQLERKIDFLGVVDNFALPKILNQCNCFVLPSIVETFGVVYIEAAGCGLPLIAANSGGTLDIVNDNNGIIIKNACVEELVKAMRDIFEYRHKYVPSKISEEMHLRFGAEAFTNKIERIYMEI